MKEKRKEGEGEGEAQDGGELGQPERGQVSAPVDRSRLRRRLDSRRIWWHISKDVTFRGAGVFLS